MLAYLLFDKPNFKIIQKEARSAAVQHLQGSETALEQTFPRCIALFNESLRITTSSGSIRTVASPTQIGNYVLQPGSRVLLPFRQLHMNEEAFGLDATAFKADRFLGNDLVKDPSFRPFGGGITYCPGRYIARKEVVAVVVLALRSFDIELKDGSNSAFPKIDEKKPFLGVLAPLEGEDLRLRLSKAS